MNVLVCHGIGNHRAGYAEGTIRALKRALGREQAARIHWSSVLWGQDMDSRQNGIMDRCASGGDLDWKDMRRELIIGGLGDACAYLGHPKSAELTYYRTAMRRVDAAVQALPPGPLVLLCHSMGCAVMMDYLVHERQIPVQCAIFFGCNLPLFWMAYPPDEIPLPPIGRVYNLYDSDDLLGYPIKPFNAQTQGWVTGDYRISTGTVLGAHTGYWTDRSFVRWVKRCLRRELRIACKKGA